MRRMSSPASIAAGVTSMSYKLERLNRARAARTDRRGGPVDPEEEKRRRIASLASGEWAQEKPTGSFKMRRGTKFTLLSFGATGALLAIAKKNNPDADMSGAIMMFALVFIGCMIMNYIGRKIK